MHQEIENELLFIQNQWQQGLLMEEQKANDFNPIYALANVTGRHQDHVTETGSHSQLSSQLALIQEMS